MESKNMMTIDGRPFSFTPGETILEVAERNGIYIPTLCYLKGASPLGACRMCLVEIKGVRDLMPACVAPAKPDMTVRTETPAILEARRMNLEVLLASGHHNCLAQELDENSWTDFQLRAMDSKEHQDICPAYGDCRLQEMALLYRVKGGRFTPKDSPYPIENVNPFFLRDFSRCILCGRCVLACNEIQVNNAISFGYRGTTSKIVAKGDLPLKESDCVFCGECVQACPVGALVPFQDLGRRRELGKVRQVRTTCCYCGVGCQIYLHVEDNRIIKVTGVENVGPNYGRLCVKGRYGYDFVHSSERLTTPLIKEKGTFREASWEEALGLVAQKLGEIRKNSGPDSIGLFTSARASNEDNYMAMKFTRAVLGTNNIDHCARL